MASRKRDSHDNLERDMMLLLLTYRVHRDLKYQEFANKVYRVCEIIKDRTLDSNIYSLMQQIIKAVRDKRYASVKKTIALFEKNYVPGAEWCSDVE